MMDYHKEYEKRIVVDSNIHFGKPCVTGTRIPVEDVLELIQEGTTFTEIVLPASVSFSNHARIDFFSFPTGS